MEIQSADEEIEALRDILKKVRKSPRWWASLSYVEGCHGKQSNWTEKERLVLQRAFGMDTNE